MPKPVEGKINVPERWPANNHNWQETTAVLCEVSARDARFAVAVVEKPVPEARRAGGVRAGAH